jgi:hypothetical protein
VEFVDASREGELFPPADHPQVLTVGAADPTSSIGPTEDRRVKPDLLLSDAEVFFSDGTLLAGSSVAAADFAGIVAVLKAAEPDLAPGHLLDLARRGGGRVRSPVTAAAPYPPGERVTHLAIPGPPRPGPSPAAYEPTRPAGLPTYLERRLWATPSRVELREAVRRGH